ncbi:MAG: sulfatase [Verrucomicrobiae bacterium]|nr:sulfatase [Verrucomicrobiae bacterium]
MIAGSFGKVVSLVCALGALGDGLGAAERPNFIVINVDDLGYADIGPFGSRLNRTPNLDRMAKEGRKLTCFYAAPVCSPSRAALMTGCYPKRVLPIPGVLFPGAAVGLNPVERTVAELLKDAGYRTACIGKWHLGDQPEFLPTRQGFDYYLGIPYSNDMGMAEEGSKSSLGEPMPERKAIGRGGDTKVDGADEMGLRGSAQPPLPLVENETVIGRVRQDEQQAIVETYTTAARRFIRECKGGPFFMYLPHSAVHFPIYPGKRFAGKSPNGIYSDWVEEVDWSVGQVLDTLREEGLDSRTLVIFTSDNGGTQRAVNAPLRGNKGSTWEGGMRVPTLARWPGHIPAGTTSDAITGMIDVLPTLVGLAGGKLPEGRRLDGADIWPILSGAGGAKAAHDTFYFFRGLTLEAVRSGPWKLHLAPGTEAGGKAKGRRKAAPGGPQLFNLETDIGESADVSSENPDVVARLKAIAEAMGPDLGLDGVGSGCRELGRVPSARPLIGHDGSIREGFGQK